MLTLGTVRPGQTIYIPFDSFAGSTGASITISGLAVTDIEIYKDGSTTQRSSDNGYTLLDTDGIDFDSITGIQGFSINLADNSDAGFWAAGSRYFVVVSAISVDSQTVNFIAATFNIGYPDAILNTTIASLSTQTSFTLTSGPAEDDALNGCVVCIHDIASAVQLGFAIIADYTGASKTVTLLAGTTFSAAAGDNIAVFVPRPQLDGIATLLSRIGTPSDLGGGATVAQNLSDIEAQTDNLPAIETKIDTIDDLIDTEITSIMSSLASLATALNTIDDLLDTEIAAIKTKTDQMTFTNSNKLDASLLAAADIAAAVANKIADHIWRRTYANIRASSDGDAVAFRSGLGAQSKLVNKWFFDGADLVLNHEDDSTEFGRQTAATSGSAEPITELDTN